MSVRRVVGYYDSRQKWLADNPLPELDRAAVEELAFLIPREEEVFRTHEEMTAALAPRGIECALIEAGDIQRMAGDASLADPGTICWNMTDGFFPVTASYFPALCAMFGWRYFGNSASLQLAVQDKYLQHAMCRLLGIRTPETYLYDGAERLSPEPPPEEGFAYFVKPFDLANSIGIFNDAECETLEAAIERSVRICEHYQTKTLIQRYIPGCTVRVNYVAAARDRPVSEMLGMHVMRGPPEPDRPFSTFDAHFEDFAQADADYAREAQAVDLIDARGDVGVDAARQIRRDTEALVRQFGLRDFFSMDYKVTAEGQLYYIEVNTLPFARNAGLRAYCRSAFDLTVGAALAEAIVSSDDTRYPREW
ncbi:MAG: D-alanine:D-lactate ligase-like protein [Bradyrhizobium sp.]|nr:D-alanine:D-lactate ligase-like protein [Bradyrhizobium sp.]